MVKKSAMSKACAISPETAANVLKRDNRQCIICGKSDVQIAHYIPRSRGGKGVEQNLACLCVRCHYRYDGTGDKPKIKKLFKEYLTKIYGDFPDNKYVFKKENENEL